MWTKLLSYFVNALYTSDKMHAAANVISRRTVNCPVTKYSSAVIAPIISTAPGLRTLDSISMNGIPVRIPATPGNNSHNTGTKPVIIAARFSIK